MNFCPNCGTKAPADQQTAYCGECGTRLGSQASTTPTAVITRPAAPAAARAAAPVGFTSQSTSGPRDMPPFGLTGSSTAQTAPPLSDSSASMTGPVHHGGAPGPVLNAEKPADTSSNKTVMLAAGAGAAGLLLIVLLATGALAKIAGILFVLVLIAGVIMAWMTPIIIAFKRDHPSKLSITVINLVFGWTFFGWMVALIWSLSNNQNTGGATVVINQGHVVGSMSAPMPQATVTASAYQVGDVVNGHRFNGVEWIRMDAIAS